MSERNDVPNTEPSQPTPVVTSTASEPLAQAFAALPPPPNAVEDEARSRIAALEREAKALGSDPSAAILFHEIGLLWEDPLKNPRNAAVAYQNAYKLQPKFLANIRAARRLFADVGNWQMVVQLLEAELSATDDLRTRAALLFEKGAVLEQRLSREEDALKTYRQVLELGIDDVSVLIQLEQVYAEKADWQSLVKVYRLLATAVKDDALKSHYLAAAGQILEDRLKELEAASQLFREAFAIDRRSPLVLSALKRAAMRENAVDDLLSALAAEAELQGANAAPTYLQIAKVYQRLERKDDVLAALMAARKVSPNDPLVLSELAQLYEQEGRHEQLADVLSTWVGAINDENEVVAINLRLAALYEELKRDTDAIGRYQAILARVPGHGPALAGLGKLYHRNGDWAGLLATFDAEIAAIQDPKQKAARMFKAAEILEERLGRQEEAIQRYNQCLQLQPGYLPAQKALTRLFERQNRHAELVAMYEQDLLQTSDREQIISTLNKMASIYEDRLGDLEHAIECMKRILELQSDHLPTLRNLARLYERAGRWQDLIQVHETEATLAGDTKQVLSLHHRNAEILEEQLKDRAGAIAAYERLLALSPSYVPALKALGRLYAQDGRWEDLVRMYRAEEEISPSTEQAAALIFKIGELYEGKLAREDEAIASYQEVLTLSPSYFPAVRALARIWRAQGAWESLIEVLRAEAANRTDPLERANALYEAAAIWEDHLQRPEMAIEGYQEVLRLTPGHDAALSALERLYTARENLKDLIAILDRETQVGEPAAKVAAYLKLARLYLDRLNEASRAAQCCEAVLAIEPKNLTALKLLERIRAGDRPRRAELKVRLADVVNDSRMRTALKLSAAIDVERNVVAGPVDGAFAALLTELKEAFAADPGDAELAFALERALRQSGDWAGLAELYARRLEVIGESAERIEITLRIADLYEHRLADAARAIEWYQKALALDPQLLPALQGARRVHLHLQQWAKARDMLEAEARVSRDVQTAIDAYVGAGKLTAERLGELDRAAACYRKALERDPLHPDASRGLEDILAKSGDAADLAALHERRGEAKLAQRDTAAAAGEFFLAGRTWLEKVNDIRRALAAVDRALAAQPTHAAALELKGDLELKEGRFADAAAAYAVRVQQGGDPLHLAKIHLKLGALYHDHLSDATRASAHLMSVLGADALNAEALERLAAIHSAAKNWTGAADCLRKLIEVVTDAPELARHHIALARIVDEGFGDPQEASAIYRRALELSPGDADVMERLVQIYERLNDLPELVELLERQAQTADIGRAVTLRLKIGEIYARPLDQPQRAIASFQAALALDSRCVAAHERLAELYMRDAAAAPMAIDEHRALLSLDPARVESLHALFRLYEGLRQTDRAFCIAGLLHFLKAANDAEAAFYAEARNRLPQEASQKLEPADVELLLHPSARSVLVEVLKAIGDQLSKVYPPSFEQLGIDKRADRLKPDHAVHKAIRSVAQVFDIEDFEVYQARRGQVFLETTEPLAVCVGQEVVRKYNVREQRFLLGRAAMGLYTKSAVVRKLSTNEVAELLGASIRIFHPEFPLLGRRNDEASKQLRKAYSRRALKQLEGPAGTASLLRSVELDALLEGLDLSADRAGLLVCGDVAAGMTMLLRDEPNFSAIRSENTDIALEALRRRVDVRELFAFALSDDFFRLRQKIGLSV